MAISRNMKCSFHSGNRSRWFQNEISVMCGYFQKYAWMFAYENKEGWCITFFDGYIRNKSCLLTSMIIYSIIYWVQLDSLGCSIKPPVSVSICCRPCVPQAPLSTRIKHPGMVAVRSPEMGNSGIAILIPLSDVMWCVWQGSISQLFRHFVKSCCLLFVVCCCCCSFPQQAGSHR